METFVELWSQGDTVTHATLIILLTMSVASWTTLAIKLVEQTRLRRHADRGLAALDGALASLPEDGPFRAIAAAGLEALHRFDGGLNGTVDRQAWLSLALNRALARSLGHLQGGLAVLATIASTAPFVGLFGTVWGIHRALATIGATGQASIDKVAGPVGEALVMTAIGLAVAVPAVLAYNWLVRRNRVATDRLRDFTAGAHALLLTQHVDEQTDAAPPAVTRLSMRSA